MNQTTYPPGTRVRIIQQVPHLGNGSPTFATRPVEGVVVRFYQATTGSWFAHSKSGKLWLDRVEVQKDDGERVVCNLDQYSRVEEVAR
ncbi:MAG: hypothetical protein SFZ23_06465 [Planctomycetota bacterium]|nr:hypothetical protein [Planctomycetota bacterium]